MNEIGQQNPYAVAIGEAALILEAGAKDHFDRLVVVTCNPEQRAERFAARQKIDLETARREVSRRMAAQTTAVGGIPEIVSDRESALLVPPRNPEALCRAMRELLANETLAGGLAARASELIVTRHAPEARARRLVGIYTAALASQERYSA